MSERIKVREPSEGLRRRSVVASEIRPSLISEGILESIRHLSIDQLVPFSKQARKNFDPSEVQALANTIKEYGLRQPLTVLQNADNPLQFEIISGERRFKAAQLLGLERVPCIILNDAEKAEEIALIENIQRTDLNPIELGIGYEQLIKTGKYRNADEVADKLSIPRSQIYEYIGYAKLPDSVRDMLLQRPQPRASLRKVKSCKTEAEMKELLDQLLSGETSEHIANNDEGLSKEKQKRDRRKMTVLTVSFENGELIPQLRGLKVCPKEIYPQIKELLTKIIEDIK